MKPSPRSVPFSITLMTLMALIVLPLAGALLWLGWRAVAPLEQRSANQRVAVLEEAVERFLSEGLRAVISVGQTLAETPNFNLNQGALADEERRRALMAVLGRHPAVAAAFVGYADGRFFYAGRLDAFWLARRTKLDAPSKDSLVLRTIEGTGADRRATWWFQVPDGPPGPARTESRRVRSAYAALVRRCPEGAGADPHRALSLRAIGRDGHLRRRAAQRRRRRHRLRFHARHAVRAA